MTTKTNTNGNESKGGQMSYTKSQIMGILSRAGESEWWVASDLARHIGRNQSTVSKALRSLEDEGLVMDMGRYAQGTAWTLSTKGERIVGVTK